MRSLIRILAVRAKTTACVRVRFGSCSLKRYLKSDNRSLILQRKTDALIRAERDPSLFQRGDYIYYRKLSFGETKSANGDNIGNLLYHHLVGNRVRMMQFRCDSMSRMGDTVSGLQIGLASLNEISPDVLESFRRQGRYSNFSYAPSYSYQVEELLFLTTHYVDEKFNTAISTPKSAATYEDHHPLVGMYKGNYFSGDEQKDMYSRYSCLKPPHVVKQITSVISTPIQFAYLKWIHKEPICNLGGGWKNPTTSV